MARCPKCFHKYFRSNDPTETQCPERGYEAAILALPVGATVANAGGMTAYADFSASHYALTQENEIAEMYLQLAEIQRYLFRNGIAHLIAGTIWTLTLYGAIFGIPLIGLGIFVLVQYSRRNTKSPYAFAKTMKRFAIFKIAIGALSIAGLVWGVLILNRAKSILAICERNGMAE